MSTKGQVKADVQNMTADQVVDYIVSLMRDRDKAESLIKDLESEVQHLGAENDRLTSEQEAMQAMQTTIAKLTTENERLSKSVDTFHQATLIAKTAHTKDQLRVYPLLVRALEAAHAKE